MQSRATGTLYPNNTSTTLSVVGQHLVQNLQRSMFSPKTRDKCVQSLFAAGGPSAVVQRGVGVGVGAVRGRGDVRGGRVEGAVLVLDRERRPAVADHSGDENRSERGSTDDEQ